MVQPSQTLLKLKQNVNTPHMNGQLYIKTLVPHMHAHTHTHNVTISLLIYVFCCAL
uniref:Uncharacterized protein n=1 Tax=Anguilla anguilla TaxID=7936 RepID=A0A0E9RS19_ANGAN